MKILIKPKATEDLKNIYLYSFTEFGLEKTKKYLKEIDKNFYKLADNPNLGNKYKGRSNVKSYRAISHLIFYKISAKNIVILRILHKAMNHSQHL